MIRVAGGEREWTCAQDMWVAATLHQDCWRGLLSVFPLNAAQFESDPIIAAESVPLNALQLSRIPREQLTEVAHVKRTVREYLADLEQENPVDQPWFRSEIE